MSNINDKSEITSNSSSTSSSTSIVIEIPVPESEVDIITTENLTEREKITERPTDECSDYRPNKKINGQSREHSSSKVYITPSSKSFSRTIHVNREVAADTTNSSSSTRIKLTDNGTNPINDETSKNSIPVNESPTASKSTIDQNVDSGYIFPLVNSPHFCRNTAIPTSCRHIFVVSKTQKCYRALIQTNVESARSSPVPQVDEESLSTTLETENDNENGNEVVIITPPSVPPHISEGPPPLAGAPPSYSAVMRIGGNDPRWPPIERNVMRMQPSPPFIAPIPPPTYSQAHGYQSERPVVIASVDQLVWGPNPISVICPRCTHVVLTSTHTDRSHLTHFSALALCMCGCWPCCLLPYCMDSCKNTYHHCPNCQQFLGVYRPL